MAQTQNRPVMGIMWMVITGLLFVAVTAVVKYLGTDLPAPQTAFLRYVFGLVFFVPMIGAIRRAKLTPRALKLFGFRGVMHSLGVTLWFYAMTQISIAEVTAMNYMSPVYITLGAALFLGERLAFRRILAIGVALIGAMVILRPGFRELSPGHFAMLITAVMFAGSYLTAKKMADEVSPGIVVAMLSATVTIGLAPMAAWVWITPTWEQLAWISVLAVLATTAHYTMTLGFQAAPVTVTQPATFLQLFWAVLLGAFVFDEGFDGWVIFGGLVILAAVSFITWREAVLKRAANPTGAPSNAG